LRIPVAYLFVGFATLTHVVVGAAAPALIAADAWVRATPGADVAAAYLTLRNGGTQPITIVGVRSPLAAMAMIHETKLVGTQSTMRAREQLRLAPGETVRFAPGGLHVMLHMLAHPLNPGDEVPLVLLLEDGGTLAVTARVRPLGQD
jgi:periplasmic copper chaperone A